MTQFFFGFLTVFSIAAFSHQSAHAGLFKKACSIALGGNLTLNYKSSKAELQSERTDFLQATNNFRFGVEPYESIDINKIKSHYGLRAYGKILHIKTLSRIYTGIVTAKEVLEAQQRASKGTYVERYLSDIDEPVQPSVALARGSRISLKIFNIISNDYQADALVYASIFKSYGPYAPINLSVIPLINTELQLAAFKKMLQLHLYDLEYLMGLDHFKYEDQLIQLEQYFKKYRFRYSRAYNPLNLSEEELDKVQNKWQIYPLDHSRKIAVIQDLKASNPNFDEYNFRMDLELQWQDFNKILAHRPTTREF